MNNQSINKTLFQPLIRNIEFARLSKKCPGQKSCPAYHYECFDVTRKVTYGVIVSKYSNKWHLTCCVESESDSTDTSEGESYSSDDSTDAKVSTPVQDKNP